MASSIIAQQLRRSFAIAKKDLRIYYAKGPVVIFGILMPAFLFLAFSIGRDMSADFLLPGMLAVTTFFTASAVSPTVAPWETQARTLERLLSCPVSISSILIGDIMASFIFGIALSAVTVFIGLGIGVDILHPAVLVLGIILSSFCFSSFALIFSFPATSSPASIMMLSSLIKFPLIFISGIFVPLSDLPAWGKGLALVSPLTYFTDMARYCVNETNHFSISIDIIVLVAFLVAFLILAIKLHQRTMPKRI